MAGRAYSTEAVVLRSMRLGEADRVLHLYTEAHGRVGAVAKGVRKTMSRFGARLEPLSHVELVLHRGRGELQTVTAAQLVRSHREAREDYYRYSVGMIGAEAMLRLFSEEEANERAFTALTRPRMSSGVRIWTSAKRMTTLTTSAAPRTTSAPSDSGR